MIAYTQETDVEILDLGSQLELDRDVERRLILMLMSTELRRRCDMRRTAGISRP